MKGINYAVTNHQQILGYNTSERQHGKNSSRISQTLPNHFVKEQRHRGWINAREAREAEAALGAHDPRGMH